MRVIDASIQLIPRQAPSRFRATAGPDTVRLEASPFQVTARCRVEADASFQITAAQRSSRTSPRLAPWKLGFMQVQVSETLWAYYRGATDSDGSSINDWSAHRGLQVCRDYQTSSGTVFYECSNNIYDCYGLPDVSRPSPWSLEFYFGDNPINDVSAFVHNTQTNRRNYLHEVRWSTAFITTLTEQVAVGVFKHHRHFSWSGIWHLKADAPYSPGRPRSFDPVVAAAVGSSSGFWRSEVMRGGPSGARYLAVLNDPSLKPSCNDVVQSAAPARSFSSSWQRFPVMDRRDRLFV